MANIIEMPKLSDTMTEGTLVKWLRKEGDTVKSGDMLAEVETDKATMELESFFDGTLLKIFSPDGPQVAIGDPLCAIGKPGEKVDAPAAKTAAPAPVEKKSDATAPADAGASTTSKNEVQAQPATTSAPKAQAAQAPAPEAPPPAVAGSGRFKISP